MKRTTRVLLWVLPLVAGAAVASLLVQRHRRAELEKAPKSHRPTPAELMARMPPAPVRPPSPGPAPTGHHEKIPMVNDRDPAFSPYIKDVTASMTAALDPFQTKYGLKAREIKGLARHLAIARVSQIVYEATIADIGPQVRDSVAITVPAYPDAALSLKAYLDRDLAEVAKAHGRDAVDDIIANLTPSQFNYLGSYRQQIAVGRSGSAHADAAYSITQTFDGPGLGSPVRLNTYLGEGKLGTWDLFSPWFPK